jgi:hypothetical protein
MNRSIALAHGAILEPMSFCLLLELQETQRKAWSVGGGTMEACQPAKSTAAIEEGHV